MYTGQRREKRVVTVSFIIRDENETLHRAGINALQYDASQQKLYSAGRDGMIHAWQGTRNVGVFEHHTDWVNDIVLCSNGRHLFSASSDNTVKVWSAKGWCMSTLRTHKDYVKCLAYANLADMVASGGFDKQISVWDVSTLTSLRVSSATGSLKTTALSGNKASVYSLTINPSATLIASGASDKCVRLWDPRSAERQQVMKLKGHSGNVRSILLKSDSQQLLSASSDSTVRLWDLRSQQCIYTYDTHSDGVWTLQVDDSWSVFYSSGRDQTIWATEVNNPLSRQLIYQDSCPVNRLQLISSSATPSLWVATSDSSLKRISFKPEFVDYSDDDEVHMIIPATTIPTSIIEGVPAIRQAKVLSDKRHLVTRDAAGSTALYDVLTARRVRDLGCGDIDEEVARRDTPDSYIPSWFSVDLRLGTPMIHLDEKECFSAWLSLGRTGLPNPRGLPADQKINLGALLLQALLEYWPRTFQDDELRGNSGLFSLPPNLTLVLSETNGRCLMRCHISDLLEGETEQANLADYLPSWVWDFAVERRAPPQNKLSFSLQPQVGGRRAGSPDERLTASDFVLVRKLCEHVVKMFTDEGHIISPDQVELFCRESALGYDTDLRSVLHCIWRTKTTGDLVINYRINSPPSLSSDR